MSRDDQCRNGYSSCVWLKWESGHFASIFHRIRPAARAGFDVEVPVIREAVAGKSDPVVNQPDKQGKHKTLSMEQEEYSA